LRPSGTLLRVVTLVLALFAFGGCLTAEHKITRITLNADGRSGSGTVVFSNISSQPGDTADVSKEDFHMLITEYYQGNKFEIENKGMKNVRKRLYKVEGKLMGEVTFDFDNLADIGFYQYTADGPYMYYTVGEGFFTSGQYEESNGSYGGEKMPVVFWDRTQREFYFKMALSTPQEFRRPLTALFQDWETQTK
jgi:hypothetical protein